MTDQPTETKAPIKPRIGYEALASHLLDQGISADRVIKHRWPLMMAARFAEELPIAVGEGNADFIVAFGHGEREVHFVCNNLSTRCRIAGGWRIGDRFVLGDKFHPTEAKIEYLFAWLASANDAEKTENEGKPKRKRKAKAA